MCVCVCVYASIVTSQLITYGKYGAVVCHFLNQANSGTCICKCWGGLQSHPHNVVEAHCYVAQYRRIDREQWCSRINQSTDCRMFRLCRPSSDAYKTEKVQCETSLYSWWRPKWLKIPAISWLIDSAMSLTIYSPTPSKLREFAKQTVY